MTPAESLHALLATDIEDMLHAEATRFDALTAAHPGRMVLFGTGGLGRLVARTLLRHGSKPLAFCDSNARAWNSEIEGIPVISPDAMIRRFGDNASVVVTIYHSAFSDFTDCAFAAMAGDLRQRGCATVIPFVPLLWKYASGMLPYLRLDRPSQVLRHANDVREVFESLGDEASRREFALQIRRALTCELESWEPVEISESYFPYGFMPIGEDETFMDAGAYTGDTVASFIENTRGRFNAIASFEPDPKNFAALENYVSALPAGLRERIRIHAKGLWDKTGRLRFEANGTMGSSVCDDGKQTVEVIALDDMPENMHPSYIKMDIEGAELEALRGARHTIECRRPKLAVCNNHRQSHLWEVPLLIRSMNPDYTFYMRRDFPDDIDLICYAVP